MEPAEPTKARRRNYSSVKEIQDKGANGYCGEEQKERFVSIFPPNKKSSDSPSMVSAGITPVTSHSHYRMINLSITDYDKFFKCNRRRV